MSQRKRVVQEATFSLNVSSLPTSFLVREKDCVYPHTLVQLEFRGCNQNSSIPFFRREKILSQSSAHIQSFWKIQGSSPTDVGGISSGKSQMILALVA